VRAVDEPMADTSIIPMYYLAQFARESVTVCLSGDGSDESFGGYETYLADKVFGVASYAPSPLWRMSRRIWNVAPVRFNKVDLTYKVQQFLAASGLPPDRAHVSWRGIFDDNERRQLVHRELHEDVFADDAFAPFERHFNEVRGCHALDQAMYVDFKTWLADDILVKVDRMTMAHGLESRAPFLDHRVVEFAASLPARLKVRGLTTKYLLKRSQQPRLPHSIITRSKRGFNAPVSRWFNGPLEDLAREATSDRVLGQWFDAAAIRRLWDDHRARRRDNGFKLFGLTCLGLWMEQRS
jgi:asparagine synthase (glutamine-hydrolysing)